jgi:hypothetical protein
MDPGSHGVVQNAGTATLVRTRLLRFHAQIAVEGGTENRERVQNWELPGRLIKEIRRTDWALEVVVESELGVIE